MAETFYLKQNDTRPELQVTLKDGSGVAVNVTGAVIVFSMRSEGRRDKVVNRQPVTLVTAVSGVVKYPWGAPDTKGAGRFVGEFEVTYSAGGIETFPNNEANQLNIIIERQIG